MACTPLKQKGGGAMNEEKNRDCLDCDPVERAINEIVREIMKPATLAPQPTKHPQIHESQGQEKERNQ